MGTGLLGCGKGSRGEGRGGGEPDCPIFMHVYIVLCILCSMCRKEICVHVERAGWPDFLVHVYKYGSEEGWMARLSRARVYMFLCTVRGQLRNVEQIQSEVD